MLTECAHQKLHLALQGTDQCGLVSRSSREFYRKVDFLRVAGAYHLVHDSLRILDIFAHDLTFGYEVVQSLSLLRLSLWTACRSTT